MENKSIIPSLIVTAVVAAVISFGSYMVFGHSAPTQQTPGSLAGPDIPFPYLRWGGLGPIYNAQQAIQATSSVFCSIQNPSGATSSVSLATTRIDGNNFGVTEVFDISTSTTQFGSSTPAFISGYSLTTNASNTAIVWSGNAATTTAGNVLGAASFNGSDPYIIGPTTWLNWRIASATPGTVTTGSTLSGNCQAQFIVL